MLASGARGPEFDSRNPPTAVGSTAICACLYFCSSVINGNPFVRSTAICACLYFCSSVINGNPLVVSSETTFSIPHTQQLQSRPGIMIIDQLGPAVQSLCLLALARPARPRRPPAPLQSSPWQVDSDNSPGRSRCSYSESESATSA
jgi:hypothetical protein